MLKQEGIKPTNCLGFSLYLFGQSSKIHKVFEEFKCSLENSGLFLKKTAMDVTVKRDRNSIDRLSNLPDSVLISILSYLKPMEFVQTCILSKRWLNLWASVPYLDFDAIDFWECQEEPPYTLIRGGRVVEKFMNFVTNVLQRRNETMDVHAIHLFSYFNFISDPGTSSLFRAAILYAANRNLKNLNLTIKDSTPVSLPDCLFTCQSLEELHLIVAPGRDGVTLEPTTVHLPRLRELELLCANSYVNHFEKLLSGSPVLESLQIIFCRLEMNIFASQSLRCLKISGVTFIVQSVPPALSICAPALEKLDLDIDDRGTAITLREMPKVTSVNILVWTPDEHGNSYRFNLLSGLSNVVDLRIQSFGLQKILEGELPKCPIFYNLKKLNLYRSCMCCAFHGWYALVKHCPNLERLTLVHFTQECKGRDTHFTEDIIQTLEHIEEGHPLAMVKIIYYPLDDTVHELVQLIMAMTQYLKGTQIILTKF